MSNVLTVIGITRLKYMLKVEGFNLLQQSWYCHCKYCSECSPGDANDMDSIIESVNWDRLASMYVTGRTGAQCESSMY
uniref:Uncharacterized protein LOC101491067 isoform X3 n=1 Tax=Cicer arietinum TaxID=3827 RepID=A0A3Q7YC62_CICAR|nr:uncharacterized protein LOC101491067 isoform X3 [Cicer arietinum]